MQLDEFLVDRTADKRLALVKRVLSDDLNYADHWLTFWNDLLRNDYKGTGYIDGGRLQMLGIVDRPRYDTREGQEPGRKLPVTWIDIPVPDPEYDNLVVVRLRDGRATWVRARFGA